jgi:hypothetical protein
MAHARVFVGVAIVMMTLGCRQLREVLPTSSNEEPVTLYGLGDAPSKPPKDCKSLGRIRASRIGTNEPPQADLVAGARELGGNAVGRIKPDGLEDGYLGKTYLFRAEVYRCPGARPTGSASASGSTPQAAPAPESSAASSATSGAASPSAPPPSAPPKGSASSGASAPAAVGTTSSAASQRTPPPSSRSQPAGSTPSPR